MPLAHREALVPETDALLARLVVPLAEAELYLAGSAALALYLGHRRVRDLDLMAMANRLTPPERRDLLQALLAAAPGMQVETARDGLLALRAVGEGTRTGPAVRLYYYPYPLAAPPAEHHGVEVASALDLGLMKLGAIISRGSRRDFVDLYLLCRKLPLVDLLAASPDKFGHVGDFALQALKGLADLSEVEGEPMPQLAEPLAWEQVEAWLDESVRELGAAHVGLATPVEARR
ncbi:MAG TPA: nucleotidyl transferase AbiEii/AbiGii toxin family protein [Thermoanaerobaculia bacterium]|nr:nucleotidyl transferase AbiEii/AbiGii toxin family protein [Thermoanaerobaculia bacterium]